MSLREGGLVTSTRGARPASSRQAEAVFTDTRLATQADVETTYWALYAAERDYAVALLLANQDRKSVV